MNHIALYLTAFDSLLNRLFVPQIYHGIASRFWSAYNKFVRKPFEHHPLIESEPFMAEDVFACLCADIRKNGLKEPILLKGGKVIDGRARMAACLFVRVNPRYEIFSGSIEEAEDVISLAGWKPDEGTEVATIDEIVDMVAETERARETRSARKWRSGWVSYDILAQIITWEDVMVGKKARIDEGFQFLLEVNEEYPDGGPLLMMRLRYPGITQTELGKRLKVSQKTINKRVKRLLEQWPELEGVLQFSKGGRYE